MTSVPSDRAPAMLLCRPTDTRLLSLYRQSLLDRLICQSDSGSQDSLVLDPPSFIRDQFPFAGGDLCPSRIPLNLSHLTSPPHNNPLYSFLERALIMAATSYSADSTLYLYTSLTAGSSHIITATSRLETILKANKIPFRALDCATDEKARMLWGRRSKGKKLPGLVKYGTIVGVCTHRELSLLQP